MTTIYLAGPITGWPDFNKPAFVAEQARLEALGHMVLNPHTLAPEEGHPWQYYMKICIRAVTTAEEVRMLPHWQNSKGATWEHRIASMLEIPISYCPVLDNPPFEAPRMHVL